ncbi:MAG: hypothetical protein JW751_11030 [Polyangiaceae bacterium]|nr:hypothetical protein [Polyangiaceae bacterium]
MAESPSLTRALGVLEETNRVTREAGTRIFHVFQALRRFARLDESPRQWADIHEGLESALGLLAHRLGGGIEIVRELGGLPRVRCYASELNQVFSIVLTNAAEAINGPGSITLRTRATEATVRIEIADTGRGMEQEHLERAFDPGFTTKGVRVGTGLSLAIAFRIIERHRGHIRMASEPGRGTTVVIELPIADAHKHR